MFTVENPRNSYIWLTPWFARLLGLPGVRTAEYQACMHGALRDKWQALGTNIAPQHTTELEVTCDGSHAHLPWGASRVRGEWHFATANECAYPAALCATIAACVREALQTSGVSLMPRRREDPRRRTCLRSSAPESLQSPVGSHAALFCSS